MDSWRQLKVWEKSHKLALGTYRLAATFPGEERFRLSDQICRAASSIPANIVEGQAKQTTREYIHFLYNARGSLEELRYHFLLAKDLGFMDPDVYSEKESECEEISRMLNGLIQSLKRQESNTTKGEE